MLSDKEYVGRGGGKCPKCGSDQLEGDSWNADSNHATQEVACLDCGFSYLDFYELTGYMKENGDNPEGKTPEPLELTETELTEVLELARFAMADAETYDDFGVEKDLSDEYLMKLRDKIITMTDKIITMTED